VALVIMGHVPAFPFSIGSPGWVRSSAWIWLFSSTESTDCVRGPPTAREKQITQEEIAQPGAGPGEAAPGCSRSSMHRGLCSSNSLPPNNNDQLAIVLKSDQ